MSALLRVYEPEECAVHHGRRSTSPIGYPQAWSECPACQGDRRFCATCLRPLHHGDCKVCTPPGDPCRTCEGAGSIKDLVRQQAGHRCVRCGHPFKVGESGVYETEGLAPDFPEGTLELITDEVALAPAKQGGLVGVNWSDCDEYCTHKGPIRAWAECEGSPEDDDWFTTTALQPVGPMTEMNRVQAAWRILTVHHLNERKEDCRWHNLVALCQRCLATSKFRARSTWPRSGPTSTRRGSGSTRRTSTRRVTSARSCPASRRWSAWTNSWPWSAWADGEGQVANLPAMRRRRRRGPRRSRLPVLQGHGEGLDAAAPPEGEAGASAVSFPYLWHWRPKPGWDRGTPPRLFDRDRKGERCRVVARGTMNSALIEFEDGWWTITSRSGLRRG